LTQHLAAQTCSKDKKVASRATRQSSVSVEEIIKKEIKLENTSAECVHRCLFCPMGFPSAPNLAMHVKKSFCYKCQKKMRCFTILHQHISKGHPQGDTASEPEEDVVFECKHCNLIFQQEDDLRSHEDEVVKCDLCDVQFKCLGLLKLHKTVSNLRCKRCAMKIHGKDQMQAHREQNTCLGCRRVFMCKTLAERHIDKCKFFTGVRSLQVICEFCRKKFPRSVDLSIHILKNTCNCGHKSKCESYLKSHVSKTGHSNSTNEGDQSEMNKRHRCSKCRRMFPTYFSLRVHQGKRKCQNNNGESADCTYCEMKLSSFQKLMAHQQNNSCKLCGAFFGCCKSVRAHSADCRSALDKTSRQYCQHCKTLYKSFKHHLKKNYYCSSCNATFPCFGLFQKHNTNCPVAGAKYLCKFCSVSLSCNQALRKHSIGRFCHKCHWKAPCANLLNSHNCRHVQRVAPLSPAKTRPPRRTTAGAISPGKMALGVQLNEPRVPQPCLAENTEQIGPKCPYCGTPCASVEVLQRHAQPSNCPRCSFAQPCSAMLARHLDICQFNVTNGAYQCPLCAKIFTNAAILGTHVQICDATDLLRRRRTFPCDECDKVCRSMSKLQRHKERRHLSEGESDLSNDQEAESGENQMVDCDNAVDNEIHDIAQAIKSEPREEFSSESLSLSTDSNVLTNIKTDEWSF